MADDKPSVSEIVDKTLKRRNRRSTNYWPYVLPFIPLAVLFISGAMGYSRLQASVRHNADSIERIENTLIQWNRSISERVQYLERRE